MEERRYVDISQLYDLFQERKECYFICCDIKGLIPINQISSKAGDLAIIESMNRLNEAAGPDDIVFRIGGDEFCILTDSKEEKNAEIIAQKIRTRNEEEFLFEDRQIPLVLFVSITKLGNQTLRYQDLFTELQMVIDHNK